MENKEQLRNTTMERHIGSANGAFYTGYAASMMDGLGQVVIIASNMNELIQRWYSMTDTILDIKRVEAVALFSERAVKLMDSGDSISDVAVELMAKD